MRLPIIRFQPQRHRRAQNGHPWVYSNEIVVEDPGKSLEPGALVEFRTHDKQLIGKGTYNPKTLIAGRLFTRQPLENIDGDFLRGRLESALVLRERLIKEPFYRLVHAEADGLPGLIVDRFGGHLSVQLNTAGMDRLWPLLEEALVAMLKPDSMVLRNDSASRGLEGVPREVKVVRGESEVSVEVHENGLAYYADLHGGQKTGWYFDQRDNRALVARYAGGVESMLDLYCNAGGFALCAAKAGAKSVTGVDSSEPALAHAQKAATKNRLTSKCTWHRAEVFEDLERRNKAKETFDAVVADPPAFVKSRKDLASGSRGYRKLARLAAGVTAPGGVLFIASCSYNMGLADFTGQVAHGLSEAGRRGRILHTVFAAPDHPVHPHLPESAYLKGLLLAVE
ncbi:MAG: class I SAM-dependent rRNA methyltransferase [Bdellovibrionales bacterium]